MKPHVLLGLSGGVDSAVAASLLQEKGYRVTGCYLKLGAGGEADAQAVAARLGLDFCTLDIREDLERSVCVPFAAAYCAGQTPSPCAHCNPKVKFPSLLRMAQERGADFVATGHYARIFCENGMHHLHKGRPANDQSYMLARLPKDWLPRILFPLGELEKLEVRARARAMGLSVADKPDSMEICFIPDGDYAAWMAQRGKVPPPGVFRGPKGENLGTHKGIHHYTLGQRRGLGIPAASRLFVSEILPETNEVRLSDGSDLLAASLRCDDWNALASLEEGKCYALRVRHSKNAHAARISLLENGAAEIQLDEPARAPTPGQLAVLYEGERVLGSGWIAAVERV